MKYFLIFFIFFKFSYAQNLSTYNEVSIKNLDPNLNKYYFLDKILNDLTDTNLIVKDIEDYLINFFYDNAKQTYNFQIDMIELTNKLLKEGSQFNLHQLNCSLSEKFFEINQNNLSQNCPIFLIEKFNETKYLYIKKNNTSFRISEIINSNKSNLKKIWLTFLPVDKLKERDLILKTDQYIDLVKLVNYYPKIKSYKNQNVSLELKYFYSNSKTKFILNFL